MVFLRTKIIRILNVTGINEEQGVFLEFLILEIK